MQYFESRPYMEQQLNLRSSKCENSKVSVVNITIYYINRGPL